MLVPGKFFRSSTLSLARDLLGTYLVHESKAGTTVGRIVETEAYLSKDDPACHASRGMTKRNEPMFGPPGISYVYLNYGIHFCFNIVSGKEGIGEAVLIRALEPIEGVELMMERRGSDVVKQLCSGPGKLSQAMAITKDDHNGCSLRTSPLQLHGRDSFPKRYARGSRLPVVTSTRIGISVGAELPYRFYVKGSEFISRR